MFVVQVSKPLCPTRWTVWFVAIDAALKCYRQLQPRRHRDTAPREFETPLEHFFNHSDNRQQQTLALFV